MQIQGTILGSDLGLQMVPAGPKSLHEVRCPVGHSLRTKESVS